MKKSFVFWFLLLLWLISAVWGLWPAGGKEFSYHLGAWNALLLVLISILGWHCFGKPIE